MKNLWSKRWFKVVSILLGILLLLFLFRNTILTSIGNWLVATDPTEKTEMCFVLGGNSFERGTAAVNLNKQFPDHRFIATGGNYPSQILCLDTMMFEAELTKHWMIAQGVPPSQVDTLTSAHSTMDESEEILLYCKNNNVKHITVISSAFHLRRVRWVFEEKFEDAGIKVNFHAAASMEYDQTNWWKNEEGLIMTNNEIVKLFYYLLKY
jgi:uncharacterized SAM-binding protein YcdF (DUF218 family)